MTTKPKNIVSDKIEAAIAASTGAPIFQHEPQTVEEFNADMQRGVGPYTVERREQVTRPLCKPRSGVWLLRESGVEVYVIPVEIPERWAMRIMAAWVTGAREVQDRWIVADICREDREKTLRAESAEAVGAVLH